MHLLDFSFPKTEEEEALEKAALEAEKEPEEEVKVYGEPDEVKPIVEPEVSIDQFFEIDLRVCNCLLYTSEKFLNHITIFELKVLVFWSSHNLHLLSTTA